jgi:hypothetical protein
MQIEQEKKTTTFKTIEENPHLLARSIVTNLHPSKSAPN